MNNFTHGHYLIYRLMRLNKHAAFKRYIECRIHSDQFIIHKHLFGNGNSALYILHFILVPHGYVIFDTFFLVYLLITISYLLKFKTKMPATCFAFILSVGTGILFSLSLQLSMQHLIKGKCFFFFLQSFPPPK